METVIQLDGRFRVQLPDGSLVRGSFHTADQAGEARLRIVAARVLRLVDPARRDPRDNPARRHGRGR